MPADSKPRTERGVWILGWVSFLTDVSSDMIYPLLPDFLTRTLKAGPAALGIIEGVAEATASLMKMVSGWWSDRRGRRKPLVLAGYGIASAVRPLVGLASSWGQVLAIRFTDRVGKGIRTSPRDALLADMVPPERRGRAFGLQRAMDNAGAVAGPLLAAFLLKYVLEDERSVFLLAAIPGLAAVLLLIFGVKEAPRAAPRRREPPRPRAPARSPAVSRSRSESSPSSRSRARPTPSCSCARGTSGSRSGSCRSSGPFFHAVKAAAGVPGGALADRIGRTRTILLGWAVYAAAYLGFAFVSGAAAMWGLFAFYALFYALTEGAERALVADLAPAHLRGKAFGAFHAAVGLAALPASVLFGVWWKILGPRAAFLIGAAIALLATAGLFVFRARFAAPPPELEP